MEIIKYLTFVLGRILISPIILISAIIGCSVTIKGYNNE